MSKTKVEYTGLRVEMARRRVRRTELAEKIDVHPNTISNWLVGKSDPSLTSVIDALKALGMDSERIYGMRLGELVDEIENGNKKTPAE